MTPLGLRKKILHCFLFIIFLWLFGLLWFVPQIPQSKTEFFPISSANSTNIIVILTGGNGRLEYSLQLLAERKAKHLFISGVGENVSIADILHQVPDEIRKKIQESDVILGHHAENTIGNAQEVKDWLESSENQNLNYKNIILVTSNYHMPRSLLELKTALPTFSITSAPVIVPITSLDIALLFSEYHKYIASKLRHLFVSATDKK